MAAENWHAAAKSAAAKVYVTDRMIGSLLWSIHPAPSAGANLGHPGLTTRIIIEMNRSILRMLSGTLHLFEKRIPRFRIGHVRLAHS